MLQAAFSYVSDYLEGYGGDPDRVSVVSDSAGAFLATYAVATTESDALQEAFGLDELSLRINALVCFSGMFYTNQRDPLGLFYADALYGDKLTDPSFMKLMDPECPEVMSHLPPMFLVSSDADILKNYTKRYASALHEAEHPCEFLYYRGNKELDHAFPTMKPYLTESQEVLEKLIDWLNQVDDEE